MEYIKPLLLIPAAFTGTLTGLVIGFPPATIWDAVGGYSALAALYLGLAVTLYWLWQRPGRFFGHSFTTWAVLLFISYLCGLCFMVLL